MKAIDLRTRELGTNFAKGIDTITRAISEINDTDIGDLEAVAVALKTYMGIVLDLKALNIQQRNQILATIVRERCINDGFMSAWSCFVGMAPGVGLQSRLVQDVGIAANVYGRLKRGTRVQAPCDIKMSIGSEATYDSIYRIGPKSLGGTAWRASTEYKAFLDNP